MPYNPSWSNPYPQALRDMWADATPEEREQMKRDMGM